MKTVQDYLDLGLVFVDGDKGYKHIIESFAWRNNDGVKPEYNGDVEIMDGERNTGIRKSSKVNWAINPHAGDANICKWRPVVLQSELPAVLLKEDKPMKPVYTAEMHSKGELPPVGSDFYPIENEKDTQTCLGYTSNSKVVGECFGGGVVSLFFVNEIKPIIKTIKVNGFDVPAPMSEAPMFDSVYFTPQTGYEVFYCKNSWRGDKFDSRFLSRGLIHSTESAAIAHAKAMLGIDPNA